MTKTVKTKGKGKAASVMTSVILRGTSMIRFSYQLAAIASHWKEYIQYSNTSAADKLATLCAFS